MKKIFGFMFFLFSTVFSFSQSETINCIIFIDAKLPMNGTVQGFVEYNNKLQQKDTVKFYYNIGIISFKSEDFTKLQSLPDTSTVVMHLNFTKFQKKCNRKLYHYSSCFPLIGLLNNSYIVFSITNFNKKKNTYYFDYNTSTFQKPWEKGYNKKDKIFHAGCNVSSCTYVDIKTENDLKSVI